MTKKSLVFIIVFFAIFSLFSVSKAVCPTKDDCSSYRVECGWIDPGLYSPLWDGCPGFSCGGCPVGEVCDGNTLTCTTDCPTKSDCSSYNADCGWVEPGDIYSTWSGCSGFSCGTCGSNETCDGAVCVTDCPDSNDCSSYGAECGIVSSGISGCSDFNCGFCSLGEDCYENKCCPVEYGYLENNYVCTNSNGVKTTVDTRRIASSKCTRLEPGCSSSKDCLCLNASNYCHDTYFADSCGSQNACEGTKDPGCTQSNLYCSSNTYYNGCEDCAGTKTCSGSTCTTPTYNCSANNVWTQSSSLLSNTCMDSTNNCNYVTVGTPGKGAGCWDEDYCGTATCKNSYNYEYCNGAEIRKKTIGYEDTCTASSTGCGEQRRECEDIHVEDCEAGYTCKITGVDTFGYDDAECVPKSSTWTET